VKRDSAVSISSADGGRILLLMVCKVGDSLKHHPVARAVPPSRFCACHKAAYVRRRGETKRVKEAYVLAGGT
jgi:hypothetical protein